MVKSQHNNLKLSKLMQIADQSLNLRALSLKMITTAQSNKQTLQNNHN